MQILSPNAISPLVRISITLLILFCLSTPAPSQVFDEEFSTWPEVIKLNGTVLMSGGEHDIEKIAEAFLIAAGNEKAKITILQFGNAPSPELTKVFEAAELVSTVTIAENGTPDDVEKLNESTNSTGIWICGSDRLTEDQLHAIRNLKDAMANVVSQNGTVRFSSKTCRLAGTSFLQTNDNPIAPPSVHSGTNLVPDGVFSPVSIAELATTKRNLLSALAMQPRSIGVAIEPNATIILRQRKLRVIGDGSAHFFLAANEFHPVKSKTVKQGPERRANPYEFYLDWTAWRRQAIDRTLPKFPADRPPTPIVDKGTLIIVGGGGMPRDLMNQMVEMAGGKDAKMVYVPCTDRDVVSDQQRMVEAWKAMGVASATVFHTKDRNKANSDEEFLAPLTDATGIWFGGGRQWNFSDSYYGTKAHALMKKVLERGGVIGGSSAGASIQGRYLARANPLANFDIMAAGYERGLGFLSGVAIDQHFTQRGRQKDMTTLVDRYPQLLGIGLDEATAIIVRKSVAEVVGRGDVYFYDRNLPLHPDQPDYIKLGAGSKFDLAERKQIESEAKAEEVEREPKDVDKKQDK